MDLWAAQTQAWGFILVLFAVKVAFYYPCQNKKSFLAGRWGSWACRFNLLKKKERKKPRGQLEFSGLVFCRLVCLWVAATLGTAQHSDFRAERAVCRGRWPDGEWLRCTAILHWHTASALISLCPLSIHLFIQPSLSLCSHALSVLPNISQSDVFLFVVFFCFGYSLNKDIFYAHTPSVSHTGVFVLEDCNVIWSTGCSD